MSSEARKISAEDTSEHSDTCRPLNLQSCPGALPDEEFYTPGEPDAAPVLSRCIEF
jgi:hypothetical protein